VVAPGSAGAEVIGSAGILVSPQDASGWAAALAFPAGNREERIDGGEREPVDVWAMDHGDFIGP